MPQLPCKSSTILYLQSVLSLQLPGHIGSAEIETAIGGLHVELRTNTHSCV